MPSFEKIDLCMVEVTLELNMDREATMPALPRAFDETVFFTFDSSTLGRGTEMSCIIGGRLIGLDSTEEVTDGLIGWLDGWLSGRLEIDRTMRSRS